MGGDTSNNSKNLKKTNKNEKKRMKKFTLYLLQRTVHNILREVMGIQCVRHRLHVQFCRYFHSSFVSEKMNR